MRLFNLMGVCVCCGVISAGGFAQTPEVVSPLVDVYRGLDFAAVPGGSVQLDLFVPHGAAGPVPVIVVVPGGGFRAQGKDKFGKEAARLAEDGFAAASIGYRGAPDDTFRSTVSDCKAAVRYVRANAARFGLDGDRIGAFGQSAGGHLIQFLAVTGDDPAFEGNGGNAGVSSRIQAAVSYAGVADFIARLVEGGEDMANVEAKRKSNGLWIGEKFSPDSAEWKAASPINHITSDDPPMLLVHGTNDQTVSYHQSELMYEAMKPVCPATELLLLEGCGHGIRTSKVGGEEAWAAMIAFFTRYLAAE